MYKHTYTLTHYSHTYRTILQYFHSFSYFRVRKQICKTRPNFFLNGYFKVNNVWIIVFKELLAEFRSETSLSIYIIFYSLKI